MQGWAYDGRRGRSALNFKFAHLKLKAREHKAFVVFYLRSLGFPTSRRTVIGLQLSHLWYFTSADLPPHVKVIGTMMTDVYPLYTPYTGETGGGMVGEE